jgi:hypothetical protein
MPDDGFDPVRHPSSDIRHPEPGAAMAIMVELIGKDEVALRLRAMSDTVRHALATAVTAAAIDLQQRVREKLGGEVLRPRSHLLQDSIYWEVNEDTDGVTATIGSAVVYAAFQEYGFNGTEQVRAHLRRIAVAFGKPIAPVTAMVRAHDRKVNYPPHSFLRSSLAEAAPEIHARIDAAVMEAVKP